ncbi:MAG: BlaI/MecI/CopY family transcriptional regulator [Acidimicrobiales bacterium]|nr:BlaI/MecI/CopY family transcriptional regulator [Acidimicrobiales bacterium]
MTAERRGMGELEAEVMSILWGHDDWMTPREVLEQLDSDPPIVYSTVMTILRRLWKKGTVDRRRVGKAYTYHPVKGEGEQTAERMTQILDAAEDPEGALTHFLAGLDAPRRRQLRKLLDRSRR